MILNLRNLSYFEFQLIPDGWMEFILSILKFPLVPDKKIKSLITD